MCCLTLPASPYTVVYWPIKTSQYCKSANKRLYKGNAWLNGEVVYRILPQIHPYYVARASLGLMLFISAIIGAFNILATFLYKGDKAVS